MRRDVSLLRDGIERVADVTSRSRPSGWNGRSPGCMADHVRADRRGRPGGAAGPRRARSREFGIRLPGDLVVLSRALVTLDGTLRVLAPGMSLVTAATRVDDLRQRRPHRSTATTMVRDELLAALPHLRRLPDRIDRILTLTGRGDLRIRTSSTRTRAASCARSSTGRCSWPSAPRSWSSPPSCSSPPTPARRSAAAPGCSRSSGTAGCSSARSCCCASSPPSLGTGRHDARCHLDLSTALDVGRRSPTTTRGRRASATSATPATSSASLLWGAGRGPARAVRRARHVDQRRCDRRPRPRRGRVPDAVRELVLAARPGRRASSCRSLVVGRARARSSAGGGSVLVALAGAAGAVVFALLDLVLDSPAARPGRGDQRHLGGVDQLPVARVRRRRRRGDDGRQAVALAVVAAGRRRRARRPRRGDGDRRDCRGARAAPRARRGRRRSARRSWSSFGAPNRRPAPAASRSRLRDAGLDVSTARRSARRGRPGPALHATLDDGGRAFVKVYAQRQPRRRPPVPRLPHAAAARPERRLAVAVARARRRARGVAAAAGAARPASRCPRLRGAHRACPTARWRSRSSTSTARPLDELDAERDRRRAARRGLATGRRLLHRRGLAHRSLRPANILVCRRQPVIIDFGFGDGVGDAADCRRSTAPSCSPRSPTLVGAEPAARVGASRAIGPRRAGRGRAPYLQPLALSAATRKQAIEGDARASCATASPTATGEEPAALGAAGAGPAAHAAHDRRADRRVLRAAPAARRRRRQRRRAAAPPTSRGWRCAS